MSERTILLIKILSLSIRILAIYCLLLLELERRRSAEVVGSDTHKRAEESRLVVVFQGKPLSLQGG